MSIKTELSEKFASLSSEKEIRAFLNEIITALHDINNATVSSLVKDGAMSEERAANKVAQTDTLLKQIVDGRTFTLTLSKKGEQRQRVIRIQKEWVEIAKNYKCEDPNYSISWMNLLKVWLYLIDNKKEIIKTSEIAEALGISQSTVKSAKRALEKDIHAIMSKRITTVSNDGLFRCLGSSVTVTAWLDE